MAPAKEKGRKKRTFPTFGSHGGVLTPSKPRPQREGDQDECFSQ